MHCLCHNLALVKWTVHYWNIFVTVVHITKCTHTVSYQFQMTLEEDVSEKKFFEPPSLSMRPGRQNWIGIGCASWLVARKRH